MDDSRRVRLGETLGDLGSDPQPPAHGKGAGDHDLAEALPVHELHREKRSLGLEADVVNRHDVGMIQGRGRTGFLLEAGEALLLPCELRGQNFERDLATEPGVSAPIDFPHASGAERRENLIGAEPFTGSEGHRYRPWGFYVPGAQPMGRSQLPETLDEVELGKGAGHAVDVTLSVGRDAEPTLAWPRRVARGQGLPELPL